MRLYHTATKTKSQKSTKSKKNQWPNHFLLESNKYLNTQQQKTLCRKREFEVGYGFYEQDEWHKKGGWAVDAPSLLMVTHRLLFLA